MMKPDEEQSFFDRERDRLTGEIATVRACFFFWRVLPCHRERPRVRVSDSFASNVSSYCLMLNHPILFYPSGIRRTIIEQQFPKP